MPKGFITLTSRYAVDGAVRLNPAHIVSYLLPPGDGRTLITMASADDDGNDCHHVDETPEQIDALIEQAQGAPRARSEFAQAMGDAIGAFGGGR